jgi:hypothetical protein
MPKVRRSKKRPPEGWDLIEETLESMEQKMREGKRKMSIKRFKEIKQSTFKLQPKLSHTKESE